MLNTVKAIVISSIPLLGGSAWCADGNPETPATQPATQPTTTKLADANAPLIIPDGTTGSASGRVTSLSAPRVTILAPPGVPGPQVEFIAGFRN